MLIKLTFGHEVISAKWSVLILLAWPFSVENECQEIPILKPLISKRIHSRDDYLFLPILKF